VIPASRRPSIRPINCAPTMFRSTAKQRVAIDEWGTERIFMKSVTCNLLLFGAPHNDAGRRLAVGRRRET
jgi:hypothetical protein